MYSSPSVAVHVAFATLLDQQKWVPFSQWCIVGKGVGETVGETDGIAVGTSVGAAVGPLVTLNCLWKPHAHSPHVVGINVGAFVGIVGALAVGIPVGDAVGETVGAFVGVFEGPIVVGPCDGFGVGGLVGNCMRARGLPDLEQLIAGYNALARPCALPFGLQPSPCVAAGSCLTWGLLTIYARLCVFASGRGTALCVCVCCPASLCHGVCVFMLLSVICALCSAVRSVQRAVCRGAVVWALSLVVVVDGARVRVWCHAVRCGVAQCLCAVWWLCLCWRARVCAREFPCVSEDVRR